VNLFLHDAAEIICVANGRERMKRGPHMRELPIVKEGAVLVREGLISWMGPTSQAPSLPADVIHIDCGGKTVLPGLIDSHTHLVFAGSRADEFEARLQGVTYQEIAARGGGINATVRAVRAASKAELKAATRARLAHMLRLGVTTVEIKSGYGLSLEDEIKCLEVIAELKEEQPCELVPTFMGAHEVPPEFRDDRQAYLNLICREMIPEVARRGLAEFCDVFCEKGVFDLLEAEHILWVAKEHGLKLKIHADEFTPLSGAELAGRLGATSADHLLQVTHEGILSLRQGGVIATLLPGTAFFLGLPYAPARRLIDAGLPVALASDCNPGSCMTENLPLIGSISCTQMKMLPAEVITALTLNAAAALDRSAWLGSIEVGKQADLIICDVPDHRQLFYHFGVNHVWRVIKSGRVVVGA
jgi:imidazolonepropionase